MTMRPAPAWSHEECVKYESAPEIITSLIGFRSLWIAREEARPVPDREKIAAWERETGELVIELRGLVVTDRKRVDRIRDTHGPTVRQLVAEERAAQRSEA